MNLKESFNANQMTHLVATITILLKLAAVQWQFDDRPTFSYIIGVSWGGKSTNPGWTLIFEATKLNDLLNMVPSFTTEARNPQNNSVSGCQLRNPQLDNNNLNPQYYTIF